MTKATYPIEDLALFQRFQTRAAYLAVFGKEPPEFNSNQRPKYWQDSKAAASGLRNITYERTIAVTDRGMPAVGADGKPFLEILQIPKLEAATVNIPPDGTNIEGSDVYEVGMPLKALPAGHELFFQFGGVVAVKDTVAFAEQVEGFTAADREMIRKVTEGIAVILKKLGV